MDNEAAKKRRPRKQRRTAALHPLGKRMFGLLIMRTRTDSFSAIGYNRASIVALHYI
jgi:hypothetical protein